MFLNKKWTPYLGRERIRPQLSLPDPPILTSNEDLEAIEAQIEAEEIQHVGSSTETVLEKQAPPSSDKEYDQFRIGKYEKVF